MSRLAIIAGCAAMLAAGCAGPAPAGGDIMVFAASSLTEPFVVLGERFEERGVRVAFNFAGSSALAAQIRGGARADVFAAADEVSMGKVAGAVVAPRAFARNTLAIVVERGNPRGVRGLGDLARDGLVVVLCAQQVPCGALADEALAKAGVTVHAASREDNVRAVLTKVRLGEADAGVVYVTDAAAGADNVQAVDIADRHNVVTTYPVAALADARNPEGARAFVRLVLSQEGASVLASHGFLPAA